MPFFAQQPQATVLLEACGSASFWAREIEKLRHRAVLLPPQHVRRYRTRNKTDRADAKALLEAFRNEDIRPVPVKTPAQQTLGALHRLRSAWIGTRTARLNAIRGLLREQGLPIPIGARRVVPRTIAWVEDAESSLPAPLRFVLFEACAEVRELDERLQRLERQLEALAKETPLAVRLRSVPGVGLLTATAIAGFVGDLTRFPSGRHFASYVARAACRTQQSDHRARQQARTLRLGGRDEREELRATRSGRLERRSIPAADCEARATMKHR